MFDRRGLAHTVWECFEFENGKPESSLIFDPIIGGEKFRGAWWEKTENNFRAI